MNLKHIVGPESELEVANQSRERFLMEFEKEMTTWQQRASNDRVDSFHIVSEMTRMHRLRDTALAHVDTKFWLRHRRDSARMICKAVETRRSFHASVPAGGLAPSFCS